MVARLSSSCQVRPRPTSPPHKPASTSAVKLPSKPLAKPRKQPAAPKAPPAAKTYHHGNLRESLLQAAEAVLAQRGVQGITLRDVAKTAGVSHAAPYHHFASLNELLAAVAQRGFTDLGDSMARAATQTDTHERLMQISQAYVRCAQAHPARFRLMFAPQLAQNRDYPELLAASQRAFGILLAAANAHDPANGLQLALCGWSLSHGMGNLLIDGAFDHLPVNTTDHEALVRQLTQRALG